MSVLANNQLRFPVLVIKRNTFYFFTDWAHFSTGHRSAFVRNEYKNQFLLDSNGFGMTIADAKKLHGIGFFNGWTLFGNQKIKLEYLVESDCRKYTVDEVKSLIINSLSKWQDLDDLENMESYINSATTIIQIMNFLMKNPWTDAVNSKWY
ncbi:MAG: hypothetical protein JNM12_12025 [Alphaproteobacteria bacterium]|nr:hypothetical protein [Alphaproteobacteria bacterium]